MRLPSKLLIPVVVCGGILIVGLWLFASSAPVRELARPDQRNLGIISQNAQVECSAWILVSPLGVIPAGRAAGEKAWLFVDEIVVNPSANKL